MSVSSSSGRPEAGLMGREKPVKCARAGRPDWTGGPRTGMLSWVAKDDFAFGDSAKEISCGMAKGMGFGLRII